MEDSWKTDGNCNNCRRNGYCTHKCSASRRAEKELISYIMKRRTDNNKIEKNTFKIFR